MERDLEILAARLGRPKGQLIREALKEFLQRRSGLLRDPMDHVSAHHDEPPAKASLKSTQDVNGEMLVTIQKYPHIEVQKVKVSADPSTHIFSVAFHRDAESVWCETCNTEDLLKMFLRGVQAGFSGFVTLPEIPVNESAVFEQVIRNEDVPL
jgi:hypothetical protein